MSMQLTPEFLRQRLAEMNAGRPPPARLWIAFSGGADSAVLLHLAAGLSDRPPVTAVYVDHGLNPASAAWAGRAESFAAGLGVELVVHSATVTETGAGLEAAARDARYRCFESLLRQGDWLLSAHHEDDQAETLLLHLLRGSGVLGLAGIAPLRSCGAGWLARPLLDVSREQMLDYAERESLEWIEDPSNQDNRFDRNFLRNTVLPAMRKRWPALGRRLRRSAELAREASDLQDALAAIDLAAAGSPDRLQIPAVQSLDDSRQRNLLRYALRRQQLPTPPAARLQQITRALFSARDDAQPLVTWNGVEARRYRGELFLRAPLPALESVGRLLRPGTEVSLGEGLGTLRLEKTRGRGIREELAEAGLEISGRRGGERLRPSVASANRALKTLMQDAGILPWMRDRLPLLVHDGRLVAVADRWIHEDDCATGGYAVRWNQPPTLK